MAQRKAPKAAAAGGDASAAQPGSGDAPAARAAAAAAAGAKRQLRGLRLVGGVLKPKPTSRLHALAQVSTSRPRCPLAQSALAVRRWCAWEEAGSRREPRAPVQPCACGSSSHARRNGEGASEAVGRRCTAQRGQRVS